MSYVANTPMTMVHEAREATRAGRWSAAHDLRLDLDEAATTSDGRRSDAMAREFDLLGGRVLTQLDTFDMLRFLTQRALQAALSADWPTVEECTDTIEDLFTAADLLEDGSPDPISAARAYLARGALEMIALHRPTTSVVIPFPGGRRS